MFSIILCSLLLLLMLELTSSATVDKGGALVLENLSFLIFCIDMAIELHHLTTQDPYGKLKDWPVGFGELTNTGKTQHFKLGQWLRGRYDTDFLPEQYSEQHIYVRSTDVGRTIASALTNLAGIYPPTGDQIWDKSIHWLPIPVHTVPVAVDWLLNSGPPCPAYDQIMAQVIASSDFQKFFTDYRSQIDYVLQNACVSSNLSLPDQLSQIMQMRDTLFIETLYKKAFPAFATFAYPSEWIDRIALLNCIRPAYTPQLAKFHAGYVLKEILDRSILLQCMMLEKEPDHSSFFIDERAP